MSFVHFTIHRKLEPYFSLMDVYPFKYYTSSLYISILDLTSPSIRDYLFILILSRLCKIALFSLALCSFWHFRSSLNNDCLKCHNIWNWALSYHSIWKLMKRAARRCLKINILETFFLSPVNQNNVWNLVLSLAPPPSQFPN